VTPTERRALVLLLLWLLLSATFDGLRRRRPEVAIEWLGPEYARELGAAPSTPPHGATASRGAESANGAEETATAALPYDADGRLDVNAADSLDLLQLRGVGPVTAGRILARRRSHGVLRGPTDLLAIRGIGPATLDRLLPQIRFAGPDSTAVAR
jgi:predicted flap endonuclease-1-like 5' DNA nuclease